jgi:hypothetical protein
MTDPTVRLLLRLPIGLKTKLAEIAEQQHRSLNKQIAFVLERFVKDSASNEVHESPRAKADKRRR